MKQLDLKKIVIAASAFACASLFSLGWSGQDGVSLSVSKAEAQARVGPWSGNGYSYTGWADYAARNGIGCVPGTAIKGGDSLMYVCQ